MMSRRMSSGRLARFVVREKEERDMLCFDVVVVMKKRSGIGRGGLGGFGWTFDGCSCAFEEVIRR